MTESDATPTPAAGNPPAAVTDLESPAAMPNTSDTESRAVIEKTKSESGNEAAETSAAKSGVVTVGSRIGPYQLVRKLGQGGMGAVYEARHTMLDKTFALKVLPPGFAANATLVTRFEREMKAVGKLDHPNIIKATNADEWNGTLYLVMEYVEGTDLSVMVKDRGPLSVRDACLAIQQAALGLQHAHEHGLVHRDIKPSNLFLTQNGQVKLLDLGLARVGDDDSNAALTSTGQMLGTPDYMAPEQWDDTRSVDARADLYSLGCTLAYLLTGRAPFDTGKPRSFLHIMKAHSDTPPPDLTVLRSGVPAALNVLFQRLLAKNPDDRFATAAEVAAKLEPLIHHVDTVAQPSPQSPSQQKLVTEPKPESKPESTVETKQQPAVESFSPPSTGVAQSDTATGADFGTSTATSNGSGFESRATTPATTSQAVTTEQGERGGVSPPVSSPSERTAELTPPRSPEDQLVCYSTNQTITTDPVARSKETSRLLKDAGVALTLLFALGIVFVWDRMGPRPDTFVDLGGEVDPSPAIPAVRLRIGVVQGEFDDMGKLLRTLGEGYQFTEVALDELINPATYDKYDILLVTCGGYTNTWLGESKGTESRGRGTFAARPEIWDKVAGNLRAFVKRGGTLYASDWRFSLIANAFEEFVDHSRTDEGQQQTITADVADAGLREQLGPTIPLKFDQPGWHPAAFKGDTVVTYLRGSYKSTIDRDSESPLLVKFPVGDGAVIFTSFHNEDQNSEIEIKLLKYLVFATVTAQTEAKVTKMIHEGGFSPSGSNLLSASAENPSVTRKWLCTKKGAVRFVLGFQDQGARLKLTVVGPGGQLAEKEGTSTLEINLSETVPGEWTYTITAVKVPWPNFPFTLTIGEK